MRTLVLSYILLINFTVFGQINRYWDNNFNAEASLTSGAVVAKGAGPTALFFNPAQIAEAKYSNLTFNANIGTMDYYKGLNAFGPNNNIDQTSFYIQPRYFSLLIKHHQLEDFQFQFAVFTKDREDFRYKKEISNLIDSTQSIYNFDYSNYYDDTYIGIGTGYKINDKLNFGYTLFGSFKTLKKEYSEQSSTFINQSSSADQINSIFSYSEAIHITSVSLLSKIGFQYELNNVHLGLNITLPSLIIHKSGKAEKNILNQNLTDRNGNPVINQTGYVNDNQAKGTIKDPLSISFGINWTSDNDKDEIRFKTEYFHDINEYNLIDSDNKWIKSYKYSSLPADPLIIKHQASSIINFAFGYSHQQNEHLKIHGGIRTDFNTQMEYEYDPNDLFKFNYNMYHLTSGLGFDVFGHNIIFGLEYSLGKNNHSPTIINSSSKFLEETYTTNDNTTFIFNRHRLAAYLGITFNFGANQENAKIEIQ